MAGTHNSVNKSEVFNSKSKDVDSEHEEYQDNEETEEEFQKHPLENRWVLWYFKSERKNTWTENLKKVVVFDTVEDFWGVMNYVEKVSNLPAGCDYSVFKEGIEPMWEDRANVKGGRWLIMLEKVQRAQILHEYWTEMLMMLIGEAFGDDSDEVCGATVNVRGKGDKLSVWTRDANNEYAILRIGYCIRDTLGTRNKALLYQKHDDQQNKTNSVAKTWYKVEIYDSRDNNFVATDKNTGMFVEVKDPAENILLSRSYSNRGHFTFTTHQSGEFKFCLSSRSKVAYGIAQLRVHLQLRSGASAIDYAAIARKEKMNNIQLKILQIREQIKTIEKYQTLNKEREVQFRAISDTTDLLVYCMIAVHVLLLVFSGSLQTRYLRSLIIKKKLV